MPYSNILLACVLFISGATHAISPSQEEEARIKLHNASKGVVVIKRLFDGPNGMVGAVVGDDRISWVLPDGYVVFGSLFSPEGENITAQAKDALFPQKKPSLLKSLEKTQTAIRMGHSGPVIAYIHDISCPFCEKAWNKLQQPLKDGVVQLDVYLVVGQKPKTDLARLARVYSSKDPAQYLIDTNGGHDIEPTTTDDFDDMVELSEIYQVIELNTRLFLALLERPATPTFMSGNKVYQGANVSRFLPALIKDEK